MEIGQCQMINFGSLCDIFDLPIKDMLECYHVRGRFDKSDLLAKIQMVCCETTALINGGKHLLQLL